MTIEKIVEQNKKALITLNGEIFTISSDCIILYNLKKGSKIDDNTFAEILEKSDQILCKDYLYTQIEKYSKTEKGYRDKLYEKGFKTRSINLALRSAKEYGYINDSEYALRYYDKYKDKKGIRRIINELKIKGISNENLLFLNEKEENIENIIALGKKFMRKREKTIEEKNRLIRHLAGKGFSFSSINLAINQIFQDIDS